MAKKITVNQLIAEKRYGIISTPAALGLITAIIKMVTGPKL